MGIVVIGAVFVDIKGYPESAFIPTGRNAGRVEQIHGGVGRNVAEDVANCELRPTFLSVVDHSGISADVVRKLKNHKVNTDYIRATEDGLGTWLAVFDNDGEVYASISKRPNLLPIADVLDEYGDEIFRHAHSVILEIDINGGFQIKEKCPEAVLIFLTAKSLDEIERRLRKRNTETDEVIEKRLEIAKAEIERSKEYDFVVYNEDIDKCAHNIIESINM